MQFSHSMGLAVLAASIVSAEKTARTFSVLHFYGDGPLVEGRMDPLITPGQVSGHVHTVQGGNAFALTMKDGFNTQSTCTSSLIKNDNSNYWAPKMYFKSPTNGSFVDVPLFYMNVYYFFEPTDDNIVAFPPGMRMLAGDAMRRSPPSTGTIQLDPSQGTIQPVQFTCPRSDGSMAKNPTYPVGSKGLNGIGIQDPGNKGAGVGFPNVNCDGYASPLRADIHFPSCYNPAAGLDNFHNNTAYPSGKGASKAGYANCPAGWIHTPHLFYELYWNTPIFASEWSDGGNSQPFVLAQGDPTGYGLHADFIAGWEVNTLQTIIDTCNTGDNAMDTCPNVIGGINKNAKSCNMMTPFSETIKGPMKELPGCNPIQSSGTATKVTTCGPSPTVKAGAPGVIAQGSGTADALTVAPAGGAATLAAGKGQNGPVTNAPAATATTMATSHSGAKASASATAKPNSPQRRSKHLARHAVAVAAS